MNDDLPLLVSLLTGVGIAALASGLYLLTEMLADSILPDLLSAGATILVALIGFAAVFIKQKKTDVKVDEVHRETEARNGETLTFRAEVRKGFSDLNTRLDRELGP